MFPLFAWFILALVLSVVAFIPFYKEIGRLVAGTTDYDRWYRYASIDQRRKFDRVNWGLVISGIAAFISFLGIVISLALRFGFGIDIV